MYTEPSARDKAAAAPAMKALETTLQRLRPLVQSRAWDYCVVWQLGDDPSRFIKWMGCCCNGGYGDHPSASMVNEERAREEEDRLVPLCRDLFSRHPAKTSACVALSRFPPSIPLYSGVHGEAVISMEARWLSCTEELLISNQCHESTGTRVLIPVVGGLIEIFAAKQIPRDQKIIDLVADQCKITMAQKATSAQDHSAMRLNAQPHDAEYSNNRLSHLQYLNLFPGLPIHSRVSQPGAYPVLEGSPASSNPSNEHFSMDSCSGHPSPNVSVSESTRKHPTLKRPISSRDMPVKQEFGFLVESTPNHLVERENLKSRLSLEREQHQSKNLITERNRRKRIRNAHFALRALVPKITKMDTASILKDAIEYIEELQEEEKKLVDELREMAKEEFDNKNGHPNIPEAGAYQGTGNSNATMQNKDPSSVDEKKHMEVQVEVNQIGARDFLLKCLCKKKQGGFLRLMEAVDSLGLQVIDANISAFNGKVLNILRVEVNNMEIQPKTLKDSVIKSCTSRSSRQSSMENP
ncbi:transcription factor bHLH90 isoform X2 [Diospyros lotus]|uniref:transcription factor bHLH90 isoform X2 n=1 Tax=Diospyros lotus TaxID=55363 RepID=UPI0022510CF6|nr:transcription factor bHLH90 isoform X2 [Diospyros lotus]